MNGMDRRTFLRVGAGALMAGSALPGLLTACSSGSGGGGSSLQLSNDKATWKSWFQQEGTRAKSAVHVGWTPNEYSDTNAYQAAIRTSGGSSKAPDLYTWWSGWLMKEIVDAGFADDVSSLWDQEGDAYSQGLRSLFTFNDKTYGAPLYFAPWVVLYNTKVFEQYGLTPPKTWSDMQHILTTLKSNGVTPLAATINERWPTFTWFEALLVGSDPQLYQALMAGKAKYTDQGVVDVFNQWRQMIKAGYFTDPSAVTYGTTSNNFVNFFKQGKVAMINIGTWYEPTLTAAGLKPNVDYGGFILPNVKDGVQNTIIIEAAPLVVSAHGSSRQNAEKALGWFMSKQGQQEWIKATGFTSARSDVPSSSPVDKQITAAMQAGGYQQVNRYWEATPHDIVETAIDQFAKFMLHPGDPNSILSAIQEQADNVWKTVK